MAMLKARLYEAELQRREAVATAQENAKTDIGWGHQIRNYVLAPYQLVKDLRTGVEKGNPDAVLDGDLDGFMAAALAARAGPTRSEASAQARGDSRNTSKRLRPSEFSLVAGSQATATTWLPGLALQ